MWGDMYISDIQSAPFSGHSGFQDGGKGKEKVKEKLNKALTNYVPEKLQYD